MKNLDGKTCIVTGGNTGIGKETARGLARMGATVVLACRDPARAEEARADIARSTGRDDVGVLPLDLGNLKGVHAAAEAFMKQHPRLHVLVNNAGVWTTSRRETADGLETTFGVNHVGTMAFTRALLPALKAAAPSRVVVLSSALHYRGKLRWDDLQHAQGKFDGVAAYNASKLCNVMFTNALARRLEKDGITVNAVHPGVVATELSREYPALFVRIFHLFLLTPEKGAACSLHVATSEEGGEVTGRYFEKSRQKKAAAAGLDEQAQERLWTLTEEIIARHA